MIMLCPGYERYGIDEKGNLVSSCRGTWKILTPRKGVLCLHGEKKTITCKIAKFRYCVKNQINPSKISCIGALITSDGRIMTKADFTAERNSLRPKLLHSCSVDVKIEKLKQTILYAQAAIDYLCGNSKNLLRILSASHQEIVNSLSCNKSLAEAIVSEAELQLFDAIERGAVTDPKRWLYKRARGILSDRGKYYTRFSDRALERYL